jgi:hypothetical protein
MVLIALLLGTGLLGFVVDRVLRAGQRARRRAAAVRALALTGSLVGYLPTAFDEPPGQAPADFDESAGAEFPDYADATVRVPAARPGSAEGPGSVAAPGSAAHSGSAARSESATLSESAAGPGAVAGSESAGNPGSGSAGSPGSGSAGSPGSAEVPESTVQVPPPEPPTVVRILPLLCGPGYRLPPDAVPPPARPDRTTTFVAFTGRLPGAPPGSR